MRSENLCSINNFNAKFFEKGTSDIDHKIGRHLTLLKI